MLNQKRQLANQVLIVPQGNDILVLVPAYVRMAYKKLSNLDVPGGSAEVSSTVLITVCYEGLSTQVVEKIKKKLQVAVNNTDVFSIAPQDHRHWEEGKLNYNDDQKNQQFTIQWRNKFSMDLDCNILMTPFQLIDLSITFSLKTVSWKVKNKKISFKFNLMNKPQEIDMSIMFSLQATDDYGQYGLAESSIGAEIIEKAIPEAALEAITKQQSKLNDSQMVIHPALSRPIATASRHRDQVLQQKKQVKVQNWGDIKFKISFYRYPFTSILTLFLPIMILAIINLAIFFQANDFTGRISSIATLMVAYSAFLPTVRSSIPPSPNFTIFDFILYSLILTSMLCLLRSYLDKDISPYTFEWNSDPIFIICLIIICSSAVFMFVTLIIHKCLWQPKYNQQSAPHKGQKTSFADWNNQNCTTYLKRLMQDGLQVRRVEASDNAVFLTGGDIMTNRRASEQHSKPLKAQIL